MSLRYRFLFAGGGTGGHLYPAVAVAEKIREIEPQSEIIFLGNKDKIEGRVIPKLRYKFYPIWISGMQRKLTVKNLLVPLKVVISMLQSLWICARYKPMVAIGSGGYVSGPAIWAAKVMGAKVILLEQNSYPGVTTRLLENKAEQIHITFDESRKYLRNSKNAILSGNPVRASLHKIEKKQAVNKFELKEDKMTIFIVGGSLGAKTINESISENINFFESNDVQLIWQTGKFYYENYKKFNSNNIKVMEFIDDMQAAYSAADIVISRAGASAISELAVLALPTVLIPSPNVAANHQYYNAKALADENAAILVEDKDIRTNLFVEVRRLLDNSDKLKELSENIKKFSKPSAAENIAKEALKFAKN